MSGHSKWSTIKRQKGAADLKRGQTFTKLSNAITIAIKESGGITDPDSNFRLRLAIDAARAANMPKDNIQRAIERFNSKNTNNIDEVMYEGFGPYGIGVIVKGATDNKMRTTSEVKNIFERFGGNMGQIGSVSYLFKQLGKLKLKKGSHTLDEIFLIAADCGAEDVVEDEEIIVFTKPEELANVRNVFIQKGIDIEEEELTYLPQTYVKISEEEQINKVVLFLDKIEEQDDVQKIYSNAELDN